MTVLNFPASPSNGDTYEENGVVYTWNGSYWSANNASDLGNIYVAIAGDRMTGNLELPGGGGDTAALQKQEIQLMVDAGGGGGTGPTDLYWERDAGALSPKVSTDNVDIGDGKILLNADGSITAAGDVNAINARLSGFCAAKVPTGSNTAFSAEIGDVQNFKVFGDGTTYIGGILPASPNISLNADGKITAAGTVQIGDYDGDNGVKIYSWGETSIKGQCTASTSGIRPIAFQGIGAGGHRVFLGKNSDENEVTTEILGDGSAEFAGPVQVGSSPTDGAAAGVKLYDGGAIHVGRGTGTTVVADVFRGYATGNSDATTRIASDGSATFANQLSVTGGGISCQYGPIKVFAGAGQDFGLKVALQTDGSGEFMGGVYAQRTSTLMGEGTIAAQQMSSGNCFEAKNNSGNVVWHVDSSGSSTFSGSIIFNLEAEDPTKYTTEVDEEGNETQTYIGATLDVKESIETAVAARAAMRETFQELLVAVQSATDFGELKSAMLVALEDYA